MIDYLVYVRLDWFMLVVIGIEGWVFYVEIWVEVIVVVM